MAPNLRITITGLCLYVWDKKDGKDTLHILMPNANHHDRHDVALYTSKTSDPTLLNGQHLDFGDMGVSAQPPSPLGSVFNFNSLGLKLRPELLTGNDVPGLYARVTLVGAKLVSTSRGAYWSVAPPTPPGEDCPDTPVVEMSHRTEWEVPGISGNPLPWSARDLNGTGSLSLPEVRPEERTDLYIIHAPPAHHPDGEPSGEPPLRCTVAEHFRAFYSLLSDAPTDPALQPVPHFQRDVARSDKKDWPKEIAGMLYTCMSAEA